MKEKLIYTIGHSTRSLEDFIDCLKAFHINCLANIRIHIMNSTHSMEHTYMKSAVIRNGELSYPAET